MTDYENGGPWGWNLAGRHSDDLTVEIVHVGQVLDAWFEQGGLQLTIY